MEGLGILVVIALYLGGIILGGYLFGIGFKKAWEDEINLWRKKI